METLDLPTIEDWRTWLSRNHNCVSEIWLVFYKGGLPSLKYKETLDEALCYGWVDSIIKKIDEEKYVRKYTPRRDGSKWSLVNKTRVEELIAEGRMTEHGLAKVEAGKKSGSWDNPVTKPEMDMTVPEELAAALAENPKASEFFESLAKTYRKQYIGWIATAKRAETRARRTAEAIKLLSEGKKLGLK